MPWINGERQAPMQDAYQHLRITGVPYAVVNNLNAATCTRSFLDDPETRLHSEHINNETRTCIP